MKKINKTTLMLFALVLSLSVTVGATLAYFSDYEQAAGGATLNLGGKTELTEGSNENEKDIVIKNTGKTNMIVRVGIYGPDEMAAPVMKGDWIHSKIEDGGDGMYYYGKVLKPGEDTGAGNLVAKMTFTWEGEEPDYYFEVTVVHEGAQAIYDENNNLIPPTDPGSTQPYWDADAVAQIQLPDAE